MRKRKIIEAVKTNLSDSRNPEKYLNNTNKTEYMAIPKVKFEYSPIYDEHWKKISKTKKYPSSGRIYKFIKKIETMWRRQEKKVLTEIPKITQLKWYDKEVKCYVVGQCVPFSAPLTIPMYEKYPDYFIDNLIHELIHVIFTPKETYKHTTKAWQYINRKYRNKPYNTRIHIPLHAFHKHIYLKLFNKKRLERDIRICKQYPTYKKSWEIVNKEGYKNIISEFTKRIQK